MVDIYHAVTSISQLRKLALRFPGRSVYAKLMSRIYRWKRVHKLPSVEMAFEEHQQYSLDKIVSSMGARQCEDEDDDVAVYTSGHHSGQETEKCQLSPSSKRLALAHRATEPLYCPTAPSTTTTTTTHRPYPFQQLHRPQLSSKPLAAQSSASTSAHHTIIRDVIGEVLPALLQQQKALIGSAFSSMRSSADIDDTAMAYGCRHCETLQRELLQMEAVQASLRAELESLRATKLTTTAPNSQQSVLQCVIQDDEDIKLLHATSSTSTQLDTVFTESELTTSPFQSLSPPSRSFERCTPTSRLSHISLSPVIRENNSGMDSATETLNTKGCSGIGSRTTRNRDEVKDCQMVDRSTIVSAAQEASVEPSTVHNRRLTKQLTDDAAATLPVVILALRVVTPHSAGRKRKTETERLREVV